MIQKMTRYSIIAFQPELMDFLDQLQELGVMDITRSFKATDETSSHLIEITTSEKKLIKRYKEFLKNLPEETPVKEIIKPEADTDIFERIDTLLDSSISLKQELTTAIRERNDALPWGDFDPADVDRLQKAGFTPHFHMIPDKKFNPDWEKEYPLQLLNSYEGKSCFVVLSPIGEPYNFPLQEFQLPLQSARTLDSRIASLEQEIQDTNSTLAALRGSLEELERKYALDSQELDKYFASAASKSQAEGSLSVLEGFAPTNIDASVADFLNSCDYVVWLSEPAKAEDNPPIKLKNNRFSRLFEIIGNMYMLPTYDEVDLTPYFAPFYMLFFGLCLGDMGYGLIILLASLFVIWKVPSLREYGKLGLWLGIGTIIMPMLNGTFFGAKIYDLFNMSDNIKGLFFTDIKMFWFAIIFGLFQIIVARLISAIYKMRRIGWQHGMSNIGWCMILIWIALLYAGSQMGRELMSPWVGRILGIGGLALVLLFTKPVRNPFKRLFGGVGALYDITGFFGDVLSYIRLFGLGAAGGSLGMVINAMSMALKGVPYAGWILFIVLLIFGHLFVMLLSAIGAFVHPMRLTFVEFYKNADFTGGGKPYRPLNKNN
ncbi:MAG TPA: V-type ATPase 116kDa subunit family protein [Bacteroidales bacterium]|jgi:V/A-type H+-transporting ATPase subunit I|nr:V-type ATPase 116kDa subunit family protein [Bacteroidales bacterium]